MDRYFSKFWFGLPFDIFNLPHLISLGIIMVACLIVIRMRMQLTLKNRGVIRSILATSLLISQTSFVGWLIYIEEASLATILPLHLCSLFIILSSVMLIRRSYRIFEYSYFIGSGGAIIALITPDIGMYNFPHFLPIQTMVAHGCLLLAQVYMVFVEGFRPTWQSLRKVYSGVLIYSAFIGVVNASIGANYMFFAHKPEFPTLLDYFGPRPWYIPITFAAGAIACLFLYLPFSWIDRARLTKTIE